MARVFSDQRSKDRCKKLGWLCWKVERWIPQANRRVDLFGFADLLVLDGQPGCLAIQSTGDDFAAHRDKIQENEHVRPWLSAGLRFEVWSWAKRKQARGGTRMVYKLRIHRVWLNIDGSLVFEPVDPDP